MTFAAEERTRAFPGADRYEQGLQVLATCFDISDCRKLSCQ
ncbi:hypothetical protein [Mesorhizobium silamurunense]|nr:hypothetical protein [Mesorhizobium silamurunense]